MSWYLFLLIPVILACCYWFLTSLSTAIFLRKSFFGKKPSFDQTRQLPFVSLIRPVCGLEKNLYENLATACHQDYPNYEIIYGVQNKNDPALPVLERIKKEHPQNSIQIVVDETSIGSNGRLSNLYNASLRAKGEIFIFSDSDMYLERGYLQAIVAPFTQEKVGLSCTIYKAWQATNMVEFLELLSVNADFVPSMIFAIVTKAATPCPGASQAIKKEVLDKIGGLKPLAHYLVEDFELGKRVKQNGFEIAFVPYVAKTTVDLKNIQAWWNHQVYWDQNTRAANATGFFFTILIRGVPFACLYALLLGKAGIGILFVTVATRLLTAALNSLFLRDTQGLLSLWLLPLRDVLGCFVWFASLFRRKTYWKGKVFLVKKGKMIEFT